MFDAYHRPLRREDVEQLEQWRTAYPHGSLELPHGYFGPAIDSVALCAGSGELIGSLTASVVVSLDPLIHNPDAKHGDIFASLFAAERDMERRAREHGARSVFIAVPDGETSYHGIVKKVGFEQTVQFCKVYSRHLR